MSKEMNNNMKRWSGWKSVWGVAIFLMIVEVVLFIFFYHEPTIESLGYIGWIILYAAAFLGVIPVFALRKKGEVVKGDSYIHTSVLVDSGLYAIIRHPQYLSFILICLGIILVAQQWLIAIIGVPAMLLNYMGIRQQDHFLIQKFGDNYLRYMKKVPRINFLVGIVRLLRRGKRE
jgi:protein-S-isoprenylcysteine O-methyltransferase Ste14